MITELTIPKRDKMSRPFNGVEVSILSYIIDDDKDDLLLVEQLLRANNISHIEAYDRPEEFLKNLSGDIVVCLIDYNLSSGLTGVDVLKAVKARNRASFVIIVSGSTRYKEVVESLNAGADRYVDKNDSEHYKSHLVDYVIEGLSEARKRWGLVTFLESQRKAV